MHFGFLAFGRFRGAFAESVTPQVLARYASVVRLLAGATTPGERAAAKAAKLRMEMRWPELKVRGAGVRAPKATPRPNVARQPKRHEVLAQPDPPPVMLTPEWAQELLQAQTGREFVRLWDKFYRPPNYKRASLDFSETVTIPNEHGINGGEMWQLDHTRAGWRVIIYDRRTQRRVAQTQAYTIRMLMQMQTHNIPRWLREQQGESDVPA